MKGNILDFKLGKILLIEDDIGIKEIRLIKDNKNLEKVDISNSDNIKLAITELKEYFEGKRKDFTFKLSIDGTEFQRLVWNELRNIPYGQTKSYGEIAKAINNEKAARAVGNANNKNKLPIVIPCHRVIGKSGNLVGYEFGIEIKEFLLNLEQSFN